MDKVRIGISACLLGDAVRYDGGHKLDTFLRDVLGRYVEWVRVCPEVELGMGTPREPVRLVRRARTVRMISVHTGIDHTAPMQAWARQRVEALAGERLCGYVLKKDSPSCGLERVKVYGRSGVPVANGRGLFAGVLIRRFPSLPVEDEGRLADPVLRENFIERVFACQRLRTLFDGNWTVASLAAFHAAHELVLLAHSPLAGRALARVIAAASKPHADLRARYEQGFMRALAAVATVRGHGVVLERLAARLEPVLDRTASRELSERLDDYRREAAPLGLPLALIRRYVRIHALDDPAAQTYLQPHPGELIERGNAPLEP